MRRPVNWLVVVLSLVFLLVGMTLGGSGSSGPGGAGDARVLGGETISAGSPSFLVAPFTDGSFSSTHTDGTHLDVGPALPHPYRAQTALYQYEIPDENTAASATLTEAGIVTPAQVREPY